MIFYKKVLKYWRYINQRRWLVKALWITSGFIVLFSIILFFISNASDEASSALLNKTILANGFEASYEGLGTTNYFNGRGSFDYQLVDLYLKTTWSDYLAYIGLPVTDQELEKVQTIADFENNFSTSSLQQADNEQLSLANDIIRDEKLKNWSFILLILTTVINMIVGILLTRLDNTTQD